MIRRKKWLDYIHNEWSRKAPSTAAALLVLSLLLAACGGEERETEVVNNQAFLDASDEFRSKGQYQASIIESRNAIQANPSDFRGYASLAKIFIEIGQPKEAVKALESIENDSPDYALALVEAYLNVGKLRSAEDLLNANSADLSENQAALSMLRGEIALARRNLDLAEAKFKEVLQLEKGNTKAKLGIASIAAERNDFDQVRSLLAEILEADPNSIRALLFSASLKTKENDLPGAEELLTAAMTAMPNTDIITPLRYSILVALRDNLMQQGKSSEALIYSGLLAESMPGVTEMNEQLQEAMTALSSGDFSSARELLADIQVKSPGSAQAGTMLGVLEYLEGNNEVAVKQFEKFVDTETATPTALQIFALAELKLNQPEKVLERLKLDVDDSKDAKLVALYGIAAASANDLVMAEKYLLKSVELDTDSGRLRLPLVRLYNNQKKPDEALAQIEKAFASEPQDALIQSGYIQQLLSAGSQTEAAKVVAGIRTAYPNAANSQMLVARYFVGQNELEAAQKVLNRVLELGESEQAHSLIGSINLRQKDYAAAKTQYEAIVELNSENRDAYKGLITAYELLKQKELGIAAIQVIADKTGATAPILVLSEYFGRNGDFAKAFELLESLEGPDTVEIIGLKQSIYTARADTEIRSGNLDEGRKTLLEGLSEKPENAPMLARLIGLEISADNLDEADKVYALLEKFAADRPILFILKGDIAKARKDLDLAYAQYNLAWQAIPTDQMATKVYSILVEKAAGDAAMARFLQEWEEKIPESRLLAFTKAGRYLESGNMSKAKAAYEKLLLKYQNVAVIHNNLAWIYGEGEIDKALAAGKRAYELAPTSPEIIDTYGWFLYKSGDKAQAKVLLTEAAELAPSNKDIQDHLSEINR